MDVGRDERLSVLPRAGEWSESDYLWVSRTPRRLVELAAGSLEFPPRPTALHQYIVGALFVALRSALVPRGGAVLFAPLRVKVGEGRFREPDVVALLRATDPRNRDDSWLGADLAVEVISPDDPARDLVTKRAEYAAAGIGEYWLVDPRDHSVTVLALHGSEYREHGTWRAGQLATSASISGLSVAVDTLFPSH